MAKSKLEYLQKYLGGKTEEKKEKRRKVKSIIKKGLGIRIVDEDFDLRGRGGNSDDDNGVAYATKEELPQIAGIVDERPAEVILNETFSNTTRWKTLGTSPKQKESAQRSRSRHDSDSDNSPARPSATGGGNRHDSDSDHFPVRRRYDSDSDASPPRRKARHDSDNEGPSKGSDSDLSPRRGRQSDSDQSPVRVKREPQPDSDQSPVRVKVEPGSDSDQSPVRTKERNASPARRMIQRSLDRKPVTNPTVLTGKMDKTLDGKRAGLQSKTTLMEENAEMKRREKEMFEKAGAEITGRGAKVVARADKQKIIDEKEEKKRQKEEKIKELEEKYKVWNKGVKQQEQFTSRINEMAHEMSKPLTRHAGDEDLERHLKGQIHEEDPMAAYVAKKQQKGKPERPKYSGPLPPPNRYGILPGYRWDGVDRSSGFEKEWFESQNSRKALEEEAYKWRSEDL